MDTCIMNTVHSFMHVIFQRACACECIQTRHACAFMDIYSCAQVDKRLERLAKDMKVHMPACLHACVQANAHTPMNSLSCLFPPSTLAPPASSFPHTPLSALPSPPRSYCLASGTHAYTLYAHTCIRTHSLRARSGWPHRRTSWSTAACQRSKSCSMTDCRRGRCAL